jgi:hypothetical protein
MGLFLSIYSVPLIYLSVLSPVPHCYDYHGFMVSLVVNGITSPTLFSFSIALLLWFICLSFARLSSSLLYEVRCQVWKCSMESHMCYETKDVNL